MVGLNLLEIKAIGVLKTSKGTKWKQLSKEKDLQGGIVNFIKSTRKAREDAVSVNRCIFNGR